MPALRVAKVFTVPKLPCEPPLQLLALGWSNGL